MPEAEDKESPNSVVLVVHCPWCSKQEPSVTIGIANYKWRIHKCLLVRRSSYFERVLSEQDEHHLPEGFPGGAAALDSIVSFCFDSRVPVMRPWNVVALRCAAEFLGMDDHRSSGELSLAQKADSYLTRTVLRSWPHTLLVLSDCYSTFMPLAEDVGLVSRCLEALAGFISTSFGSGSSNSSCEDGETSWWIDDIVRIPAAFFTRMISFLRTKSVSERLLGDAVIKWSELWLFNTGNECSSSDDQVNCQRLKSWNSSLSSFGASSSLEDDRYLDGELEKIVSKDVSPRNSSSGEELRSLSPDLQLSVQQQKSNKHAGFCTAAEKLELLEGIVEVLPYDRAAVPISFLFLLLRYAFAMDASSECKSQIETRISLQLENASLDDFLMPFKSPYREECNRNLELDSMKKIISRFLTQHHRNVLSASSDHQLMSSSGNKMMNSSSLVQVSTPCFSQQQAAVCSVARVWDQYLTEIACDGNISVQKFIELVEAVPGYGRTSHDQLYQAIHIFLKAHADITPQERTDVCRALNCLKLSQETCIQAVQNELMPLRTIVQAMFMQQLQTRNAIDSHFLRGTLRLNQNTPVFQSRPDQLQQQLNIPVTPEKSDDPRKSDDPEQEIVTEGLKETHTRIQSLEAAMVQMRKSLRENTSGSKLSDVLEQNNHTSNNDVDESSSSSSSRSSSQHAACNNDALKRKRRFFRKSDSGRRRGVTRIAKLFQKMGFLGLCKTATSSSSVDFTPDPAPNGCLLIDQKNFRRTHKKSWDEADFATKQTRHSRHHSVA